MAWRILYTKKKILFDYNHVGCVPNIKATKQFNYFLHFYTFNTGDYFGDELTMCESDNLTQRACRIIHFNTEKIFINKRSETSYFLTK